MILIFRRIRKKLLEKNNLSKYLLYAVGEIVLVMIGILMALAVNNWNQGRKDRAAGKELLERIHGDLVLDTINFKKTIADNNQLRDQIKQVLVELYEGVGGMQQVQQISSIYDQALDQVFNVNDNTYKSMISSGTLALIADDDLKESIVDLYGKYEQKRALLSSINQWMGGVAITLDTQTDFIKFNSEVSDIFTTPEMFNEADYQFLLDKDNDGFKIMVRAISATAFNQKARNAYYHQLIAECRQVLQKIDEKLDAES